MSEHGDHDMQPVPNEVPSSELSAGPDSAANVGDAGTDNKPSPTMLGIPRELRVEILSHVVRQDHFINLATTKRRATKRRWARELRALGNIVSSPPPSTRSDPSPTNASAWTRVCREFYVCGTAAFWKSNTFSFDTRFQLEQFIKHATSDAKQYMAKLIIGAGYHDDRSSQLVQSISHEPHPDWPPSLNVLAHLEALKHLEICTDVFTLRSGRQLPQDVGRSQKMSDLEIRVHIAHQKDVPCPFATATAGDDQDWILKSIPKQVLDRLTTLRIRYHNRVDYADDTSGWKSTDCLEYARNLRDGAWLVTTDELDSMMESTTLRRWLEARAAVYWDHHPPPSDRWTYWYSQQWCNWCNTWQFMDSLLRVDLILATRLPTPRSKEKMIEEGVWPFDE